MSIDYSLAAAQAYYDNESASGTNMTFQQELRAEQEDQDIREQIDEEYSNCDLAVSFTDFHTAFPNLSAFDFQRLRRIVVDRVHNERKETAQ
jgi:hypothetical protein